MLDKPVFLTSSEGMLTTVIKGFFAVIEKHIIHRPWFHVSLLKKSKTSELPSKPQKQTGVLDRLWTSYQSWNPGVDTKEHKWINMLSRHLVNQHFQYSFSSLESENDQYILSGILHKSLKTANVMPLLKNRRLNSLVLNNNRPISNPSFVGKIIEKAALIQLWTVFLTEFSLTSEKKQHWDSTDQVLKLYLSEHSFR